MKFFKSLLISGLWLAGFQTQAFQPETSEISDKVKFCGAQRGSCWIVTDSKGQDLSAKWGQGEFQAQLFPKSVLQFNEKAEPKIYDGRILVRAILEEGETPAQEAKIFGQNFSVKLAGGQSIFVHALGGFEHVGNLAVNSLKLITRDGRTLQIPPFMQVRIGPITSENKNILDVPRALKIAEMERHFRGVLSDTESQRALQKLANTKPEDIGGDFNRQVASHLLSEKERREQEKERQRKLQEQRHKQRQLRYREKVFNE